MENNLVFWSLVVVSIIGFVVYFVQNKKKKSLEKEFDGLLTKETILQIGINSPSERVLAEKMFSEKTEADVKLLFEEIDFVKKEKESLESKIKIIEEKYGSQIQSFLKNNKGKNRNSNSSSGVSNNSNEDNSVIYLIGLAVAANMISGSSHSDSNSSSSSSWDSSSSSSSSFDSSGGFSGSDSGW